MGNRAVVKFRDGEDTSRSVVYLHWNGGPESITGFLIALERRGWTRMDYAVARFATVACEFFDHAGDDRGTSVGVFDETEADTDNGDNGLFIVSRDARETAGGFFLEQYQNGVESDDSRVTWGSTTEALERLKHHELDETTHGIVMTLDQSRALRIEAAAKSKRRA